MKATGIVSLGPLSCWFPSVFTFSLLSPYTPSMSRAFWGGGGGGGGGSGGGGAGAVIVVVRSQDFSFPLCFVDTLWVKPRLWLPHQRRDK